MREWRETHAPDNDAGECSWLPDATYVAEFSTDHQRVYARAIKVVQVFWTFSGLMVVPTRVVYYQGLRPASSADRARELASRRSEMARLAERRRNRNPAP